LFAGLGLYICNGKKEYLFCYENHGKEKGGGKATGYGNQRPTYASSIPRLRIPRKVNLTIFIIFRGTLKKKSF